jgi:hypothetical protein
MNNVKDKYKTLITSCWVVLLCCFIVKLLGGNFFAIVCENEKFIKFCEYCNTGVMYWVISSVVYTVSTTIYLMAVCKFKKPKLLLIGVVIGIYISKVILTKYAIISAIVEFIALVLIPIFLCSKNKHIWKRSLIGYASLFAFQLISLVIKNIGIKVLYYDSLTALIFSIDYYIMLILYWLYSIKEDTTNGTFRNFIFRFRRQRKHQ